MVDRETSNPVRAAISHWTEPVFGLAGLALVAVVLLFIVRGWVPRERPHPGSPEIGRLAVLPFDEIGDEAAAAPDSGSILEALTSEFSHYLAVIPSEQSQLQGRSKKTLREIAEDLGADSLLVGSIIAGDSGTRVRARLVRAEQSRELFAVRVLGEDPARLAAQMRTTILGEDAPRRTAEETR